MSSRDKNSDVFDSLKHPVRRRILHILSEGPTSFSEMQKEFGIASSHLSYHLDGLANLLRRCPDGKYELSSAGKTAFSLMKEFEENRTVAKSRSVVTKKRQSEGSRKHFKIGRYTVPAWPVALLMITVVGSSVLGYYLYSSFVVPLEVKEPIEILDYPSAWSLYPGETAEFNVTVRNHSPINYSVVLDFKTDDVAYQSSYLTFSAEDYKVVPGQQDLEAWLAVGQDAPAANLSVTVTVSRGGKVTAGNIVNGDFETGTLSGWNVSGVCSSDNVTVHGGSFSAYVSDAVFDSWIKQDVNVPADENIHLEAWIYPLHVGSLGLVDYPCDLINLTFYDRYSMSFAFNVKYLWSWNDYEVQNSSTSLHFLLPLTVSSWNKVSRNVTQEILSGYSGIDLSRYFLHSIQIAYHYSNGSPGAFYVDDVKIST